MLQSVGCKIQICPYICCTDNPENIKKKEGSSVLFEAFSPSRCEKFYCYSNTDFSRPNKPRTKH